MAQSQALAAEDSSYGQGRCRCGVHRSRLHPLAHARACVFGQPRQAPQGRTGRLTRRRPTRGDAGRKMSTRHRAVPRPEAVFRRERQQPGGKQPECGCRARTRRRPTAQAKQTRHFRRPAKRVVCHRSNLPVFSPSILASIARSAWIRIVADATNNRSGPRYLPGQAPGFPGRIPCAVLASLPFCC